MGATAPRNRAVGLWRHADGPPRPPITLADVRYGPDGEMTCPRQREQAGEEVFTDYLRQAEVLLTALPADLGDGPTGLPPSFETLRWFPLPSGCIAEPAEPGLGGLSAEPRSRAQQAAGSAAAGA